MKKIIVHAGFHPEVKREYKGEHIYKVTRIREGVAGKDYHTGTHLNDETTFFGLDNGGWIKSLGGDRYETDWTAEERWGRVEEVEYDEAGNVVSAQDLGFIILRVDRAAGLL